MSGATLVAHCGARLISQTELDEVSKRTPPPTDTWFPVPHNVVLARVTQSIGEAGFLPEKTQIAVTRNDARLFATIDTRSHLVSGVTLAVAVINSVDKSLPMKMIAGNRCFCCDNLALRSDLMEPVRKKHSRFGLDRFNEALVLAVQGLQQFKEAETARIRRFQQLPCNNVIAESLMLRAYERGIVSHRLLPALLAEWRHPSFEDFTDRNYWSLENAFTTVLGKTVLKSNPQRFCAATMSLQGLLAETAGPSPLPIPA